MDPKWRTVIVVVVVLVLVIAGVGVYLARSSSSSNTSTTCGTPLKSTNPIVVDQAEIPDNVDPASTFTTPGWAAVQQVYQGLVNYNGSSSTNFSGILAKNWTVSNAGPFTSYIFHLRPGVHFSNGDPYNAYVQWYSLYRSLLMAQPPQFIQEENFYSTNFSASNPLTYYSNLTYDQAANTTLAGYLNTWNFFSPTSSEIALMETANQSFQVINNLTIALNLGYGYLATNYTYLLASISAPNSYAVDPAVVDAHGGVTVGGVNSWMASNLLGTGPYLLTGYSGVIGGGYSLTPSSNYWGAAAAAAEPWNNGLQPAKSSILVIFQDSQPVTVSDLKTGQAAEASFAYLGPAEISQLQGNPCITVQPLNTVYSSTSGAWWIYMNQNTYPFTNWSVRAAIAHAINYSQIISVAFGGYGTQWVGPVPPGYPYYNPAGLAPYPYNLTLAKQEIANSPCANNACAGITIPYAYITPGSTWQETATLLEYDLAQIGITIKPVGISLDVLLEEQVPNTSGVCTSLTTANGGPYPMGQEFYTSDYIAPDDWTQNDAYSLGSANACMSSYANATMDGLVYAAASTSNATQLTADYTEMTSLMYNNYSSIWLVVPTAFAVYSPSVSGIIQNPMASAEPFAMYFNTQYVT